MIYDSKTGRISLVDGSGNIVCVKALPVIDKATGKVTGYKPADPKHAKWRKATEADLKAAADAEAKRAAKEKKDAEAAHAAALKAQEAADKAVAATGGPIR